MADDQMDNHANTVEKGILDHRVCSKHAQTQPGGAPSPRPGGGVDKHLDRNKHRLDIYLEA